MWRRYSVLRLRQRRSGALEERLENQVWWEIRSPSRRIASNTREKRYDVLAAISRDRGIAMVLRIHTSFMHFLAVAVLCVGLLAPAAASRADGEVDLMLVLAADISRSVDEDKFNLQRDGYAKALVSPRVLHAIESGERGRIAICFVEWSGAFSQSVMVDWTVVANRDDAARLASRIRAAPRLFMQRTAIGDAIEFSAAQFDKAGMASPRRVIDISGDGTSNAGRDVVAARDSVLARGITINGLAILSETPLPTNPTHTHPPGGLLAYYENNVIGGPGAFALAAESFEAFGASLASKLVKEIAAGPLPLHR
jgi:hypothetical protein